MGQTMMATASTDAWNGGLLFMLNIFVENFPAHSVVSERSLRFTVNPINIHPKEAAANLQILMHVGAILQAETSGMFIGRRSAGILANAGFGIERDILPVPVTADHKHVFLGGDEVTDLVAFVSEALVGVIVIHTTPVRSNHWGRTDENAEGGI